MDNDGSLEKTGLMDEFRDDLLRTQDLSTRCCRCTSSYRRWYAYFALAASIFLLCLATAGQLLLSMSWKSASGCGLAVCTDSHQLYSPVNEAIKYKTQIIDTHNSQSPFSGKPRPEFDQAWYDLLYYTNIRVTADELRATNQTSIKLQDSNDYIAYLEVYHQLHCIKRMVQTRYPESYPDLVARGKLSNAHFDHCIEVLRLGTMCRADTSLATLHWNPSASAEGEKVVAASARTRQCVDWDYLTDWAKQRFTGEDFEFEMMGGTNEAVVGPVSLV